MVMLDKKKLKKIFGKASIFLSMLGIVAFAVILLGFKTKNPWVREYKNRLSIKSTNECYESGKDIVNNLNRNINDQYNNFIEFVTPSRNAGCDTGVSFPDSVSIAVEQHSDGTLLTAHFIINTVLPHGLSYRWITGDSRDSYAKSPYWTYKWPGEYKIRLLIRDIYGRELETNNTIINVPPPGRTGKRFITLGKKGAEFNVDGYIKKVQGRDRSRSIRFMRRSSEWTGYKALKEGFYKITAVNSSGEYEIFLFVSPVPSFHLSREDFNWYRTQFDTTTTSNCGPTIAAMGVGWAKAKLVHVSAIRDSLGWKNGDGSTSFDDLRNIISRYGVVGYKKTVRKPRDIFEMLEAGHIVGILYDMSGVRHTDNPEKNLFGQYYTDHGGHYLILNGFSLDKKYFIIQDPIPSDWAANSRRYADDISMYGRNRYYSVNELFKSMRTKTVLEITR